jgi:hypothetical protein
MENFKEIVAAANKLAMDGHASNYNTDGELSAVTGS